jgi:hypothetical protein
MLCFLWEKPTGRGSSMLKAGRYFSGLFLWMTANGLAFSIAV